MMTEQERFEVWVTNPPFERSVTKHGAESAWPGNYKDISVQLAWEAWQESRLNEAADIAWTQFTNALRYTKLTDDMIEDIGAKYADEMGYIPDDSHVDFGRDIQREVLKRLNSMTQAARDVLAERQRQVEEERWAPAHDDKHIGGTLATAAACYALYSDAYPNKGEPPPEWPWHRTWWKPSHYRRDLVKAGALILAEIERLDRAALKKAVPND